MGRANKTTADRLGKTLLFCHWSRNWNPCNQSCLDARGVVVHVARMHVKPLGYKWTYYCEWTKANGDLCGSECKGLKGVTEHVLNIHATQFKSRQPLHLQNDNIMDSGRARFKNSVRFL